jgi:hypothetical protein
MKKRTALLFSMAFFLITLLILGQQEIEKSKALLKNLAGKEINNFIFTTYDFSGVIKSEATPLILLAKSKTIENLLVQKCRLKEIIFLQEANGQEIVLNSYGDAGIIQFEIEHGGKIIEANQEMEFNYFRKTATPFLNIINFGPWQIFFYFFGKIFLILFFTLLPFFLSIKLFLISMSILIVAISLLQIKRVVIEKVAVKIGRECLAKKLPPKLSEKSTINYSSLIPQVFITPTKHESPKINPVKIIFPDELIKKTRKSINKIFHIPRYSFVMS